MPKPGPLLGFPVWSWNVSANPLGLPHGTEMLSWCTGKDVSKMGWEGYWREAAFLPSSLLFLVDLTHLSQLALHFWDVWTATHKGRVCFSWHMKHSVLMGSVGQADSWIWWSWKSSPTYMLLYRYLLYTDTLMIHQLLIQLMAHSPEFAFLRKLQATGIYIDNRRKRLCLQHFALLNNQPQILTKALVTLHYKK